MAVTPRTRRGPDQVPARPRPGSRVALVAPASPFDRARVRRRRGRAAAARASSRSSTSACSSARRSSPGRRASRARALMRALDALGRRRGDRRARRLRQRRDAAAARCRARSGDSRTAFVGYSDVTSLHSVSQRPRRPRRRCTAPMIEGRLADGRGGLRSRVASSRSLGAEPLGELTRRRRSRCIRPGEAGGPAGRRHAHAARRRRSGRRIAFRPPRGARAVPRRSGRAAVSAASHADAAAAERAPRDARRRVVFGQLPRCDEPGGARHRARRRRGRSSRTSRARCCSAFRPATRPRRSSALPLGVHARVVGDGRSRGSSSTKPPRPDE